jgi:hypothetical protein
MKSHPNDDRPRLETLVAACVVDGINRYMNQVLIPGGFIDNAKLKAEGTGIDSDLNKRKHEISQSIASRFKSDAAGDILSERSLEEVVWKLAKRLKIVTIAAATFAIIALCLALMVISQAIAGGN